MAGYTTFMTCRICGSRDEYIDTPAYGVCGACVAPLAASLCFAKLRVKLTDEGVDGSYWQRKAGEQVSLLMRRWKGFKCDDKGPVNKTCTHSNTEKKARTRSDDSYDTWTETYTACVNCGEEVFR